MRNRAPETLLQASFVYEIRIRPKYLAKRRPSTTMPDALFIPEGGPAEKGDQEARQFILKVSVWPDFKS